MCSFRLEGRFKCPKNTSHIYCFTSKSIEYVLTNRDNTTWDIWYHSADPRALTKSWALSHNLTRLQKVKYGSAKVTVSCIDNIFHVVRLR